VNDLDPDQGLAAGAVVRIEPQHASVRDVDRTIASVAAGNGGYYDVDAHLRRDASATQSFAETHVRRLEAMRRQSGLVEREPSGRWKVASDHLERVLAWQADQVRERPVRVEVLSALPVERQVDIKAATWIDRDLVAGTAEPPRDAGFGRDLAEARARRQQWLVEGGLAHQQDGVTRYAQDMLDTLRRRELLKVAGQLSEELDLPFAEVHSGEHVEGIFRRSLDLVSGKFAVVERSRDFTLVPWRPALERSLGRPVSGIVRGDGVSWTIGRQRGGPSIE